MFFYFNYSSDIGSTISSFIIVSTNVLKKNVLKKEAIEIYNYNAKYVESAGFNYYYNSIGIIVKTKPKTDCMKS